MPNKCGIMNCKGKHNCANRCCVFKVPREESEKKNCLIVKPPCKNFVIDPAKFFVCEKHWPLKPPMVKLTGGFTRPAIQPSVFNFSSSCWPTARPPLLSTNQEDRQLNYYITKDRITSLSVFFSL